MAASAEALYSIRPSFQEKFRPATVKTLIGTVLSEKLASKSCAPPSSHSAPAARRPRRASDDPPMRIFFRYNPELTAQWTREIADEIKNKLKTELELPRYKFVVQVVVGEQRGEGVRMGCRCFWDADTDNYAEESYRNVRATHAPAHYSHGRSTAACLAHTRTRCSRLPLDPRRTRSFALRPSLAPTCTSSVRRRVRRV